MNEDRPGGRHKVFDRYASFYDVLYSNKDYRNEAQFVLALMELHAKRKPRTMLDIGCGTGGHLIHFAKAGLRVTGFDLSQSMVERARANIERIKAETRGASPHTPVVRVADVRSLEERSKYDAAVSMFAVMGYLTSNADLLLALENIRRALKKGGLFIFDVWFGPAVLTQKPETRVKEFSLGDSKIFRLAVPEWDLERNVVRVHYTILELGTNGGSSRIDEVHEMRFFSIPEIGLLLGRSGFDVVAVFPFMDSSRAPTPEDWNIMVVARAI